MFNNEFLEPISTSVYKIPERLKEIDKGYFVVFNHKTGAFEVHHNEQIGSSLAVNIPYDELDQRTIDHVKSTRVEYAAKIMAEMEKEQAAWEANEKKKFDDMSKDVVTDIFKYCKRHESKETIDSTIFK